MNGRDSVFLIEVGGAKIVIHSAQKLSSGFCVAPSYAGYGAQFTEEFRRIHLVLTNDGNYKFSFDLYPYQVVVGCYALSASELGELACKCLSRIAIVSVAEGVVNDIQLEYRSFQDLHCRHCDWFYSYDAGLEPSFNDSITPDGECLVKGILSLPGVKAIKVFKSRLMVYVSPLADPYAAVSQIKEFTNMGYFQLQLLHVNSCVGSCEEDS